MNKRFLKDAIGLGLILWAIGFVLGMILFTVVDVSMMGWIIMPVVVIAAIFLSARMAKAHPAALSYFIGVGLTWLAISLILDYFILVRGYNAENYYDLDIMIYYAGMLLIPSIVAMIVFGKKSTRA